MIGALGIVLAILLFGMSIFVHELGHFLAAKWCGLRIDSFSIGFGKALWKKKVNGVEYRLGVLPFGGYVALPQMLEGVLEDRDEFKNLPKIHPVKRMIVAVAGGIGNILFAFLLGFLIWYFGVPAHPSQQDAVIGWVEQGSVAEQAGIRPGQTILSVRGDGESEARSVETFEQAQEEWALYDKITVTVQPIDSAAPPIEVEMETERHEAYGIHLLLQIDSRGIARIGAVTSNSVAEAAGIQAEDVVTHINHQEVFSWGHMSQFIKAHTNRAITVTVEREVADELVSIDLQMTPSQTYMRARESKEAPLRLLVEDGSLKPTVILGISGHTLALDFEKRAYPGPWKQVMNAAGKVKRVLKAFTSPKTARAAGNAISGPVGIFAILYIVKKSVMLMLAMTLLINVNLAIVNMLPLPVLDGSQIVYASYRLVTGRELPRRLLIGLTNAFVLLLLLLMVFLVYRDTMRFFWKPQMPEGTELISEEDAVRRGLVTVEDLAADRFRISDLEALRKAAAGAEPKVPEPELAP